MPLDYDYNDIASLNTDDVQDSTNRYITGAVPTTATLGVISLAIASPAYRRRRDAIKREAGLK